MRPRLLVISEDPVGGEMGGNAIRAYEIANALRSHAEVRLAAPQAAGIAAGVEQVAFDREDTRALRTQLRGVDVVLSLPQNPGITALLRRCGVRVVYDLYDAKPLQALEAFATNRTLARQFYATIALDHVIAALTSGDFLICASERQRDLWIGAMLATGLIGPKVYGADPTLRSIIDVVPFGVPQEAPVAEGDGPYERFSGLQRPAEIVLWNGGLWNWLDPTGAVEAIAQVIERRPLARLVFMGRPPLNDREATEAQAARARAAALGLLDSSVFFNDSWVPYRQRATWLLAADCALSMHLDHLETRFAFRTRLLDCFWAGLPVVCTRGDDLAELVENGGLGVTVPPGDVAAAASAVVEVLERGRPSFGEALSGAAHDHLWSVAVRPLIEYVERSAPGRVRAHPARSLASSRRLRAYLTRVVRMLIRWSRRLR
jgi:glycosyltransferase involved in cell wall biosynthesis